MKVFATRNFQGKVLFERETKEVKGPDGTEKKTYDVLKDRQIFEKGKVYEISQSDFNDLKQYGLREATKEEIEKAGSTEGSESKEGKKK